MKITRKFQIWVLLGYIITPSHGSSQSSSNVLESIKSTDRGTRLEAIAVLVEQRKRTIGDLVKILQEQQPLGIKQDAARALGVCRASEAVDVLVNNIGLDVNIDSVMRDYPIPIEDFFPISQALERIGGASVPALIKKIGESDNAMVRARCVIVCLTVEGPSFTQIRLKRAQETDQNPEVQARFALALNALERLTPDKIPRD